MRPQLLVSSAEPDLHLSEPTFVTGLLAIVWAVLDLSVVLVAACSQVGFPACTCPNPHLPPHSQTTPTVEAQHPAGPSE